MDCWFGQQSQQKFKVQNPKQIKQMQGRVQRSISSQAYSKLEGSNQLQINIQQPVIGSNSSHISSSINDYNRSELSIHDKINMLNESIRTSQKNEKLFQENMSLREKLHQTEEAFQDANIKCSLWDKVKATIESWNKDYLQLKSIENSCSDGTILKEFLSVLKDKLQRLAISQRVQKSASSQSKKKDTEYYELYEKEKKQNFEYEQHIITLNNELDGLEEENEKLREKAVSSSLQSSGVIASDGAVLNGAEKKLFEECASLKEQNLYLAQHKNTLQEQLDAEREKLKEIVESLDQYESELKRNQLELKKKNKDLETELQTLKDTQKTLKLQMQEAIDENTRLRTECHKLTLLKSGQLSQNGHASHSSGEIGQNVLDSQQYHELMSQYELLYQKYQKVKAQNEILGEQKQKLGQQMQQIEHLSKEMQYNYEVKIDDLRKHYEHQMETIVNDCSKKLLSLSEERSLRIKEAEKEKNTLTQKLERLQRSTSSQDSNKEQLATKYEELKIKNQQLAAKYEQLMAKYEQVTVNSEQVTFKYEQVAIKHEQVTIKYEQLNEKHEKTVNDEREKLARANKMIEEHEMIIQELKEQVYALTDELQKATQTIEAGQTIESAKARGNNLQANSDSSGKHSESMLQEIQQGYREKIQSLQLEQEKARRIKQQLERQVQSLRQHIESITGQLNEQDEAIEQYKQELSNKDELIVKLSTHKFLSHESELTQVSNQENLQLNQQNLHQNQQNLQQNQLLVTELQAQLQSVIKANEQLRRAFKQSEENNALLKRNIADWEAKYTHLNRQNEELRLQNQHFATQFHSKLPESLQKSIANLTLQVQSLHIQINQLTAQNHSLQSQIENYAQVSTQNQSLRQKVHHLTQQVTALNSTLESFKILNQFAIKSQPNQLQQSQTPSNHHSQNMDGLMAQALKEQIETLLEQNRTIEDENHRFRQEISESQEQVQEIQQYVKLISVQNKKIPHYEQELTNERLKSQRLKHKLTEQRDKFMAIMQKNQQVYEDLAKKSERNELILNENIRIQKEQTLKLHNLINKYYASFAPVKHQGNDQMQTE